MAELENKDSAVSINIGSVELDRKWVSSIRRRQFDSPAIIRSSSTSDSCSIHRIPHRFRKHEENAYEPRFISIGPFHYEQRVTKLQAIEEHKWRYLRAVLSRNGGDCLERYLGVVKSEEIRARECYSEKIELESNRFVEMMVLDGCFIVELFCRETDIDKGVGEEYKEDPLLKFGWLRDNLMHELIMLENQIPFFILERLFHSMNISGTNLVDMALHFFRGLSPQRNEYMNYSNLKANGVHHLLHLLHSSLLPLSTTDNPPRMLGREKIPCAYELQQVGIKFKKGDEDSFLDVKFQDGAIEIPPLKVEDGTNSLFLNLVAFEQCYLKCGLCFTTYVTFMDCLINSGKDVGILCSNGIIAHSSLGSNEYVAALFNKMAREVIINEKDFYLAGLFEEVNVYRKSRWHVWRAILLRNYNDPWAIISLLAAMLILFFTFSQTFFSVYEYFEEKYNGEKFFEKKYHPKN